MRAMSDLLHPDVELRVGSLDGKNVAYTNHSRFYVQVGKGQRGAYRTKYAITGDLRQAMMYYRGINIGNGYKKRLVLNDETLAKQYSY